MTQGGGGFTIPVVPGFLKGGLEGVFQLSEYHTARSPWERLKQGAGLGTPAGCQTSGLPDHVNESVNVLFVC